MWNAFNNKYNLFKKNPVNQLKDKSKEAISNVMEMYNEVRDQQFNSQFDKNKFQKFDNFNDNLTFGLHYVDNFTSYPIGHFIANHGRDVRSNYEFNYQRSPFQDKFDRSWDAYKKATEYDY